MNSEQYLPDPNTMRPPVSLHTHPLRGLSKKPLCTSTPDLANTDETNSSSDSLNTDQELRNLHKSDEDIRSRAVNPNSHRSVHPSTRYEWSDEAFTERKKPERSFSPVSTGYCKLHIMDKPKKRNCSAGDYSVLNIDAIELPSPCLDDESSSTSSLATGHHYFTLEVMDDPDSSKSTEEEPCVSPTSTTMQSNGYSYIELDTDERGLSPPVIVNSSGCSFSRVRTVPTIIKDSSNDNVYDLLRRNAAPNFRSSLRSVSQPDQRPTSRNTPSPRSSQYIRSDPSRAGQRISPPLVPYHKKDFKDFQRGQSTYRQLANGSYDSLKNTRRPSPKSPPAHNYDEVAIIDDGVDTDDDALTDDDIPIVLPSPTPPHTPVLPPVRENERSSSSQSSHSNLVQLIITDEGPMLMPRRRSFTADANNLKQMRLQQKVDSGTLRISSATGSKYT